MEDKQKLREEIIETTKKVRDTGLIYGKEGFDYLLEVLEEYTDYNDGYNAGVKNGMETAWELARKIYTTDCTILHKVFGHYDEGQIIMTITPQEALAKLKAYEDSKIEVGDVVEVGDIKGIVLSIHKWGEDSTANLCMKDGTLKMAESISKFKKTGKQIDIKSILEQIGE